MIVSKKVTRKIMNTMKTVDSKKVKIAHAIKINKVLDGMFQFRLDYDDWKDEINEHKINKKGDRYGNSNEKR